MRKQARKLWLGDWNREEAEPSDTVEIIPDDGGLPEPPVKQQRDMRRTIVGGAVLAALCALVFVLASSSNKTPLVTERSQTPPAQPPQAQPQIPQAQVPQAPQAGPQQGFGGPDLTGADAVKA